MARHYPPSLIYSPDPKWVAAALRPATARTWERSGILIVHEGSSIQTLSGAQQFHRDAQTIPKAAKPVGEGMQLEDQRFRIGLRRYGFGGMLLQLMARRPRRRTFWGHSAT